MIEMCIYMDLKFSALFLYPIEIVLLQDNNAS